MLLNLLKIETNIQFSDVSKTGRTAEQSDEISETLSSTERMSSKFYEIIHGIGWGFANLLV